MTTPSHPSPMDAVTCRWCYGLIAARSNPADPDSQLAAAVARSNHENSCQARPLSELPDW